MTIGHSARTTNGNHSGLLNGDHIGLSNGKPKLAELDASKLVITECKTLKPVPPPEEIKLGNVKTDYMLVAEYDPKTGWSAPEIKPYGPISLDPASSCFQYCPNVFEGMKAYLGPDGKPRLFRPQENMKRLARSVYRAALPPINTDAVLTLIKRLIALEARWIADRPGYSVYIRPTIIGTRSTIGVAASDSSMLYVLLFPAGSYFSNNAGGGVISLLGVSEHVRAWPGGTGEYKLGLNYAPGFMPQASAKEKGYDQILWLLPHGKEKKITEGGAMNFFVAVKRDDGGEYYYLPLYIDVITPALDGTILPGVTRDSCLSLVRAHSSPSNPFVLPGLSKSVHIHAVERILMMSEVERWAKEGKLLEIFCVGTAVAVASVRRIGLDSRSQDDVIVPECGPITNGLLEALTAIQRGRMQFEDWCVPCVSAGKLPYDLHLQGAGRNPIMYRL
ncbi:hypothetical protein AX15_004073 [Amanita polypyramis BW_CC]|nr:hypothetical protein AX15_004073 [Amanita polypyramis BW_CC]